MFNLISPGLKTGVVLDQLPIPVYKCDTQGFVVSYNKAALELWGMEPKPGESKYGGAWKVFDADGKALTPDHCPMARCLAEKIPVNGGQVIIQRPDGSKRRVQTNPVPVFDEAGEFTGAINTLVDITETVQNEEKQAMLATIVDTSDDAIVSKTLQGIITSWNRAAERMFGYSEGEAIGRHISMIIPAERLAEEDYIIGEIVAGKKVDHFETVRITKAGLKIPLSICVSPVIDKNGFIIGASKIARDISDRKKAEQQKSEFLSLTSHELKTPLTSIAGYLQILDKVNHEESSRKFIHKARQQVQRLTQLVADLLDVSKIEAGKLHLSKEIFDVNKVLRETTELVQYTQQTHRIKVFARDEPTLIYGNPERIEQVFINLLTNAVKYSGDSNEIIVSQEHRNNHVYIRVIDFGIGIPANKLNEIFTRFYRVDEFNRHMPGLGIGLYISRQIIEKHEGDIWAESELGKGSIFYVKLPVVTQDIPLENTAIDIINKEKTELNERHDLR